MAHDIVDADRFYDVFRLTHQPLDRSKTVSDKPTTQQRERVLSMPNRAFSNDV